MGSVGVVFFRTEETEDDLNEGNEIERCGQVKLEEPISCSSWGRKLGKI